MGNSPKESHYDNNILNNKSCTVSSSNFNLFITEISDKISPKANKISKTYVFLTPGDETEAISTIINNN